MTGMNSVSDEYADNLKIAERFFLQSSHRGFLFAVSNDELVQREVNASLQLLLKGKGKTIHLYTWSKEPDAIHPVEQLRQLQQQHLDLNGLILDGIDAALAHHPNLFVQLNFGREALSALDIPLLFWLSSRTLQRISVESIDLYNQRVGANLYFEHSCETTDHDNTARRYLAKKEMVLLRSNASISHREAHLKLLQRQLADAEQRQCDPVAVANEIVCELLSLYVKIPETAQLIQQLMERYNGFIDLEEPANCVIVAKAFHYVGEIGKALDLYKKALQSYRELAKMNPQNYLPEVAVTLNNLAALQAAKNNFAAAEGDYREVLTIWNELAKSNPQRYQPNVAATLNNLAALQASMNYFTAAETGYQEALTIWRELAKSNPQSYQLYVAITLDNFASLHDSKNDFTAAEAGYQDALGIYRELAKSNPPSYLPDLAQTLNNLAALHYRQNDFTAAEAGFRESLKIRRELAKSNPQSYLPDVAMTLTNLAELYYKRPEPDKQKSLECVSEALRLALPLVETLPYTQEYIDTALNVIKAWGIDPEEFVKQLVMHE